MSLPAAIPAAIVETLVAHLAPLFLIGANGDDQAARHAALYMLAAHRPRNEQELCLAADIVSFSFHGLDALTQSASPDVPVIRKLRLCSGAVSLNRESHRCRQKLEQMQRLDPVEPQPEPAPAAALSPAPAVAEPAIEAAQPPQQTTTTDNTQQGRYGGLTYSQALAKRMTAQRMAEKARRLAEEYNPRENRPVGPPSSTPRCDAESGLGDVPAMMEDFSPPPFADAR